MVRDALRKTIWLCLFDLFLIVILDTNVQSKF
jgi:hypothetical protein